MSYKISKSDMEWKNILTAEQFEVCRKKGTERGKKKRRTLYLT